MSPKQRRAAFALMRMSAPRAAPSPGYSVEASADFDALARRQAAAGFAAARDAVADTNDAWAAELDSRRSLLQQDREMALAQSMHQQSLAAKTRLANLGVLQRLLAEEEDEKQSGVTYIGPPTARQQLIQSLLSQV